MENRKPRSLVMRLGSALCGMPTGPCGRSSSSRRARDCRFHQPRNHPTYAQKNGMTNRKIEYLADSFRSRTPSSSPAWRKRSIFSASGFTIPTIRSYAWTSSWPNYSKKTRHRFLLMAKHAKRVDYEYERAGTTGTLHIDGTSRWLARGGCPGDQNESRLGRGNGTHPRGTICRLRKGDSRVRHPQYAALALRFTWHYVDPGTSSEKSSAGSSSAIP